MRPRYDTCPENDWEHESEDKPRQAEDEEAGRGGVPDDRRVGADLPDECSGGDHGTRQAHRECGVKESSRGPEEGQSAEKNDEGHEEYESGRAALVPGGDPEIAHPSPASEQEDVSGNEGCRYEFDHHVKSSPRRARLRERHEGVERREDEERVQGVREEKRGAARFSRVHEE